MNEERAAVFLTVWEEIGRPSSAQTLYRALREEGVQGVTLNGVKKWLELRPVKQLFAPLPKSDGHITAARPGERMAADLIDMTSRPSADGERYIIVVSDVFSRKIWTRPLKSKSTETTTEAFKSISEEMGTKPVELAADKGQ